MWEAKGDADGLLAWWRAEVAPSLPDGVGFELFRSADRVVALVRAAESGLRLPEPPAELIARAPHAWPFETVSEDGAASP
jgi:hypothetical protein